MDVREKLVKLIYDVIDLAGRFNKDGDYELNFGIIADYLISHGVTVQEWIPVSERLPQDMQERVLVTTDCDTPVGNQKIDTDRFRNAEWVRYGSHVTHWMPLPQPPKGE